MVNLASKPRVLLDANVLLAGSAYPRWPHEVLLHATNGDYHLVLCPLVIDQARRHLTRRYPQHLDRLETFLQQTEYELIPDPTSEEVTEQINIVRDVTDVAIALVAIKANVNFLVSEDKDFTVRDETTTELRQHVRPILSGTFLREVMGWTSDELEGIRHRTWADLTSEA